MTPLMTRRTRAALQSLFVGDALSMPVHWFYRPSDIERAFPGGVRNMHAAPAHHPSSIMSLHSTRGGGRKSSTKQPKREIVGDVILKGKRQYWGIQNQHYHQGMPAGENTLNAWCARILMRSISKSRGYQIQNFLDEYIEFMTADPPQHPDTYAESYHRGFFANLESGKPKDKCGALTHDTPSIGGLVTLVPLALYLFRCDAKLANVKTACRTHLMLTHPDETLARVSDALIQLIYDLLHRSEDEDPTPYLIKASHCIANSNIENLVKTKSNDLEVVGGIFSSACYITDSWPSMLYLATKYKSDVQTALIANTNAGGENAHRGSVLGSIVSLINAETCELYEQLLHKESISKEIDELIVDSKND